MSPYEKYRSQITTSWTRIDMLLALYDGAIRCLDRGIAGSGSSPGGAREPVPATGVLEAQNLILALLEGLDDSVGEPAPSIRRLLLFCLDRVQTRSPSSWSEAREILNTLRDGFRQIADEARTLELQGQLPPLTSGTSFRAATA